MRSTTPCEAEPAAGPACDTGGVICTEHALYLLILYIVVLLVLAHAGLGGVLCGTLTARPWLIFLILFNSSNLKYSLFFKEHPLQVAIAAGHWLISAR